MTITEHKRLVAANIEDPVAGELIEVSSDGENWYAGNFTILTINATYWIDTPGYDRCSWPYARRPAAAQKKRLKDEPWLNKFEEEEKPKEEEQK